VIGSGRSISVLDVVDEVRRVTGAALPVTHGPARPGEMAAVVVDPSRARASGWSPRFDFSTGVANVWEEWRELDIDRVVQLDAYRDPTCVTSREPKPSEPSKRSKTSRSKAI
jgi:hypothetical protein